MSAKIYRFPRPLRRRQAAPVVPVYFVNRRRSWVHCGGFALLLSLTLPADFFYLSGAVDVGEHDTLHAALLAVVWGFYFIHPPLLRTRLGPLLVLASRFLLVACIAGFFGGIFWLIFRSG